MFESEHLTSPATGWNDVSWMSERNTLFWSYRTVLAIGPSNGFPALESKLLESFSIIGGHVPRTLLLQLWSIGGNYGDERD